MTEEVVVQKYVKIPEPKNGLAIGESAEIKLRLIQWPGKEIFQHWIGPDKNHVRPYNCPSRKAGCPACAERQVAKLKGLDHRNIHRMTRKTLVNVIDLSGEEPTLKVFAMGPSIADAIEALTSRKGKEDPRTYDISVVKEKTGTENYNVAYRVYPEEVRTLTAKEKELLTNLFDLTQDTTAASNEVIGAAIKGQIVAQYADAETAKQVVARLKKHNMLLKDMDIADEEHIPVNKAKEVLEGLSAE